MTLVFACCALAVGCWLLAIGGWLWVAGCWLLVIGCWLFWTDWLLEARGLGVFFVEGSRQKNHLILLPHL